MSKMYGSYGEEWWDDWSCPKCDHEHKLDPPLHLKLGKFGPDLVCEACGQKCEIDTEYVFEGGTYHYVKTI